MPNNVANFVETEPKKEITASQTNVDWQRIDVDKTKTVGITSHLYLCTKRRCAKKDEG